MVGLATVIRVLILTNVKKKHTSALILGESVLILMAVTLVNVMRVGMVMESNVTILTNVLPRVTIVTLESLVEILMAALDAGTRDLRSKTCS